MSRTVGHHFYWSMHLEIKVALNFIISYLYNKLPRRRADLFGEELERLLKKKYEGHWYPEKPLKGSGYRCVHIGETVDPVVEMAAMRSGLTVEDVRIDPIESRNKIGEKGLSNTLRGRTQLQSECHAVSQPVVPASGFGQLTTLRVF
uniref:Transducer of ERBB2, 2 n=1 Tax=Anolis carolinensis TaxID=28377 RepID=G1KX78_ANOCA